MNDIFEKYAKLRELYPDDMKRIEAEEERVKTLLKRQEYSQLETTKELLALCRQDIVAARLKLATTRDLDDEARKALWAIVDSRLWFVQMVAKDYVGQLEEIDGELEAELGR